MIFESMWPLALSLAVPVVVILYLLRPRGKEYRISSILLWDKLFRNQHSRTFVEKFIHNILMYLQILILLLLVAALMSPYIRRQGKDGGSVILVFDASGSMQHDAGDGKTRMEKAIEEAKGLIHSSEETAFSIVTTDCMGTNVLAVGVRDKRSLLASLEQITCCDGPGDLTRAESTVETLRGAASEAEEEAAAAEVVLFTDGNSAEEAGGFSEYFDARVLVMGEAVRNVSNNFLTYTEAEDRAETGNEADREEAQEDAEDFRSITCASSITNYSDVEASMEVSLYEGENLLEVRQLTLPPGETTLCFFEKFGWQGGPLRSEIGSVRFAGSDERDSLSADNTAYALGQKTGQIDAVFVGEGNTYIEKAYQAAAGKSLAKIGDDAALSEEGRSLWICDAGMESPLPEEVSALVFADSAHKSGTAEKAVLTVADCELTAGLSAFTVGVNRTAVYELPDWGTGFLWAGDQCAGYYGEHDGVKRVVVGFDIRESDFPLKAEFPVFMANVLHFLGDTSLLSENVYEAGDTVRFHPRGDIDAAALTADTRKAGLYEVAAGDVTEQYVVRFATGSESDGQPTAQGTMPNTTYSSQLVKKQLRNVLLVIILLLMAAEWVVYVRQTRCRDRFYLAVRAVGVFLLLAALFGFSVKKRDAANTTVFLVDLSDSNRQNLPAMEEDLKEVLGKMPGENQYGIVTFGKNSVVEQFLTKENHFSEIMSLPDKEATNFEDALSRALGMIPANGAGRIVVLTDGKETRGNLNNTASALSARQVELSAWIYETGVGQDAYVESVELPGYLHQGDLYSMTVTVESNFETDANIEIWVGEKKTEEYEVRLNRGVNRFRFRQSVTGENVENFEVRVAAAGDTCEENDSYHAYAVVESMPKVLLVSGMAEDSSLYEEVLAGAGCDFDVVSAIAAPDSLEKLLEYKSILLENVYLSDLPEGFLANIETYVKDYGCGLVCIGGDDSFALGGYRESVLETVLPVDMELRGVNEIPTTVMIMVIDHSGSMSMAAGGGVTNLDLAVTAAKTAVDQMRSTDYVGMLTFDDTFAWVVEPTLASDKETIKTQIETIAEGGGTTIKPSLWEALEGAETCSTADIRHVILLTDGQGESRSYGDVTAAYQEGSVTLSTVAVGEDADERLLKQLAQDCSGRYYHSDRTSDIPKIFAQEVFLSGDTYLQNGQFRLAADGGSEITGGLFEAGWPEIYGYVSATPKNASRVLLTSDKDDPILTTMQYGLGHTAAWNTDVTNKWTADYAGESDYVQLWRRIVDYSVGNVTIGEDSVEVAAEGGYTEVVYQAADYGGQTKVEAVYTGPDGTTQTCPLQPAAPGCFEARLDTDAPGLYTLNLRRLEGETIANAVTTAVAVQYSEEYKFDVDKAPFIRFVERYGAMADPEENLWKQRKSEARERYELTKWLILMSILWFVLDIALRRFHFLPRDTKLYQRAVRYRAERRRRKEAQATEQPDVIYGMTGRTGEAGLTGHGADSNAAVDDRTAGGRATSDGAPGRESAGELSADYRKAHGFGETGVSEKKRREKRSGKAHRGEEPQTLDTSALLKKKDQRKQQ